MLLNDQFLNVPALVPTCPFTCSKFWLEWCKFDASTKLSSCCVPTCLDYPALQELCSRVQHTLMLTLDVNRLTSRRVEPFIVLWQWHRHGSIACKSLHYASLPPIPVSGYETKWGITRCDPSHGVHWKFEKTPWSKNTVVTRYIPKIKVMWYRKHSNYSK